MSILIKPFLQPSQAGAKWFCAGLASTYPDIDDSVRIGEQRLCNGKHLPGCRVFSVPCEGGSGVTEIEIDDWKDDKAGPVKDQVMVFQHRGKFIAVDHVKPFHFPKLYLSILFFRL